MLDHEARNFLEAGGEFSVFGFRIRWNGSIGNVIGSGVTGRGCWVEGLKGRHSGDET